MKKDTITIDDLMEKVDSYIKDPKEREKILDAYYYAKEKHAGQYRKSGEEYIIHPLNVAMILTSIYSDSECLIAGLLHDVIEDTDVDIEEFKTENTEKIEKLSNLYHSRNIVLLAKYKRRKNDE